MTTHSPPARRPWLSLLVTVVIVYAAAAVGGWGSKDAAPFYGQLALPAWAPPASVFGPVWTTLYTLMAVAAWLVWHQGRPQARGTAITLFAAQLAANTLWSWLFFHWKLGAAAFAEVVLLWLLIVATVVAFRRAGPAAAAWLLLPYLVWVSFATALTLVVWRMNPTLL